MQRDIAAIEERVACVSNLRRNRNNQELTIRSTEDISRSNNSSPVNGVARHNTRNGSRASSINGRFDRIAEDEGLDPPPRPTISSRSASGPAHPVPQRRASGFEGPTTLARDHSPAPRLSRVPTEPTQIMSARNGLRVTKRDNLRGGGFDEDQSDFTDSPSASELSRTTSWSINGQLGSDISKKMPPPPPPVPSRSKKPPPPPPPMRRSALSTTEVPHY